MKKTLTPLFFLVILASCLSGFGADQFNWIPTEGKEAGLSGTDNTAQEVKYTKIPKMTADKSKFTRKYLIDLKKFSISSDGTHPDETSKGINAAPPARSGNRSKQRNVPSGDLPDQRKGPRHDQQP